MPNEKYAYKMKMKPLCETENIHWIVRDVKSSKLEYMCVFIVGLMKICVEKWSAYHDGTLYICKFCPCLFNLNDYYMNHAPSWAKTNHQNVPKAAMLVRLNTLARRRSPWRGSIDSAAAPSLSHRRCSYSRLGKATLYVPVGLPLVALQSFVDQYVDKERFRNDVARHRFD